MGELSGWWRETKIASMRPARLRRISVTASRSSRRSLCVDELVRAGDRFVVASRDADGWLWWWVFTIRDGKVVRMDDQPSRDSALQAIRYEYGRQSHGGVSPSPAPPPAAARAASGWARLTDRHVRHSRLWCEVLARPEGRS
jgi:hypothetical protein